ncbi:MAG TPA: two-component regulator propeller domain-containing protein [Parafilimonas sp.]|nr:two-component regulator propeller domain-containing protein [Parafilimonas sp.]
MKAFTTQMVFFFVGIIFLPTEIYCQPSSLHFERISSINGLSDNYVECVAMGKKGFIWIGTADGLNRYDGKHFKVYRHLSNDSSSISNNHIKWILPGRDGRIWITTEDGLNCFNPVTGKFKRFFHDPKNPASLGHNYCGKMLQDSKGFIWIVCLEGITKLDPATEKFAAYKHDAANAYSISPGRTSVLFLDHSNNFWIGLDYGLNLMNVHTARFQHYLEGRPAPTLSSYLINSILEGRHNSLWLTCWGGALIHFNYLTKKFEQYWERAEVKNRGDHNILFDIEPCETDTALMYVASNEKDFTIFNKTKKQFISYSHPGSNDYPQCPKDLFNDHKGILWIAAENGLYKLDVRQQLFHEILMPLNYFKDCLSEVDAIYQDKDDTAGNTVWFGTWTCGLFKLNLKTNTCISIINGLKIPGHENYVPVNKILKGHSGNLWLGLSNYGLLQMNNEGEVIHHFLNKSGNSASLSGNMVFDIYEDKQNRLWIATGNGLCFFNKKNNSFINYAAPAVFATETPIGAINPNRIMQICEGPNDCILLNDDEKQILLFNPATSEYSLFPANKNLFTDGQLIKNILFEHDSILWCATNKGLFRIIKKGKQYSLKDFTAADGLSFEYCSSLAKDNCGNLWITTRKGLNRYNEQSNSFKAFFKEDGLLEDQPVNGLLAQGFGKTLFYGFGTSAAEGGINYFNPCSWITDTTSFNVALTGFKIFNHEAESIKNISSLKKINLNYKDRMITFEFAALNYIHSEKNQYAYKLEGFNKDWIQAGNSAEATYTNISGGNYTFKVRAQNADGRWSAQTAMIEIYIQPPFYSTWWFYLLCAIITAAIIYLVYKFRISQIKKLYAVRSVIARDLHDDIGSRLSSISIISQLASKKKEDTDFNVAKFYEQVIQGSKEAMELMSDIVWSVNPQNDKLSNMLIRMREYAAEILEAKNISFTINLATQLQNFPLRMAVRKDLYLIYKEALNNLAKYSNCDFVNISILKEHETLIMIIEDNGKGFNIQTVKKGNGLNNMLSRAAAIKGRLSIQSEINKGTCIRFEMPVA